MFRSMVSSLVLFCSGLSAGWCGEIIFVDPIHEQAGSAPPIVDMTPRTENLLEHSRDRARAYLHGGKPAMPGAPPYEVPPPTEAARAGQAARAWVAPPPNPATRCGTENIAGGIESGAQGRSVVQSQRGGTAMQCK